MEWKLIAHFHNFDKVKGVLLKHGGYIKDSIDTADMKKALGALDADMCESGHGIVKDISFVGGEPAPLQMANMMDASEKKSNKLLPTLMKDDDTDRLVQFYVLEGVSGSGKTRSILDASRDRWCIYIEPSHKDFHIPSTPTTMHDVTEQLELMTVRRILLLFYLLVSGSLSNTKDGRRRWFLFQLMFASLSLQGDLEVIPTIVKRLAEWRPPTSSMSIILIQALTCHKPETSRPFHQPLLVLDEFQSLDIKFEKFNYQNMMISEATAVLTALTETPFRRIAVSGTVSGMFMNQAMKSMIGKTSTAEDPWTPERRVVIKYYPYMSERDVKKVLTRYINGGSIRLIERSGVLSLLEGRPIYIINFLQTVWQTASNHSSECIERTTKQACVDEVLDEAIKIYKSTLEGG